MNLRDDRVVVGRSLGGSVYTGMMREECRPSVADIDGRGARRITTPGPICVIPDWHRGKILYTEYNEQGNFVGLVSLDPGGSNPKRLEPSLKKMWDGGRNGKFIPGS